MNPQTILVTGGAGFIGSHSVNLFLRQGKEVIVLDNLFSGKLSRLDLQHPNLEFIEGDVLEFPLVKELIDKIDGVLHLAAIASIQESIINSIYSFQVNLQGGLHILEAVRQANRPIKTVLASSAAVYGNTLETPCPDNVPLQSVPLSPYALHKVQLEEYADLYFRLFSLKSICLRYFNVYGVGQDATSSYSGVISRYLNALRMKQSCVLYGDGTQSRDFVHVTDVASANLLALEREFAHGFINIGTGRPHSILDVIDFIGKNSKNRLEVAHKPARLGDIKTSFADTQNAEDKLAFRAKISLEEGIKELVDNTFLENRFE